MKSTLYFNGTIITVSENIQTPEAVFVKNGKIEAVGLKDELMKLINEETILKDLEGKVMLPGFVDPHSHICMLTPFMANKQVAPPPIGTTTSIKVMKNQIKEFIKENNIQEGEWVIAYGYSDAALEEKRHPTKFDLDEISTKHYILVAHSSMHMATANSKALDFGGIDENMENPPGGVISRVLGTNEPDGFLEEKAMEYLYFKIPQPTLDDMANNFLKAQEYYASYGVTTTIDALTLDNYKAFAQKASKEGKMILDVVLYPRIVDEVKVSKYENRLRVGGAKVSLDGSPQGKTAWLSKPYKEVPKGEDENYRGYGLFNDKQVYEFCKKSLLENFQIQVHMNGDAATDQFLDAYEKAMKDTNLRPQLRTVLVHAQTIREDQLDRITNLEVEMIPSYFVDHTYYFGDIHIKNLGEERAKKISPLATSLKKGISRFTLHQDTPVLPPNVIKTIHCAVNRNTLSGVILGEEERISVMDAIKAVTINSSYQYFEEDRKGSIEVGKLADFVILDKNPLTVEKTQIETIKVLETIKEDNLIYSK